VYKIKCKYPFVRQFQNSKLDIRFVVLVRTVFGFVGLHGVVFGCIPIFILLSGLVLLGYW
jgi:hypothetical protein